MGFSVLASSGAEGERWRAFVDALPPDVRDLHFLPEYVRVYEKSQQVTGYLACWSGSDGCVIQPFMVRPLNGLPFLAARNLSDRYFDLSSPYGFGGPLATTSSPAVQARLFEGFDRSFAEYCRAQGFASEFCCLHPLLSNHRLAARSDSIAVRCEKSVAVIDLTMDERELWRRMSRGHKSSVNKARRNGVRITQVTPDESNLRAFSRLYFATMERHHAAQKWYFPDTHFEDCVRELTSRRVALFFAEVGGTVAAASLVLHEGDIAYYHYGASAGEYSSLRPSTYLMFETALWAKRAGKLCYHLGGGLTGASNDTLMQFKSGFNSDLTPLYVYGRVHDQSIYRALCDLKREYEAATGDQIADPGYFPLYRR